ncbi:hypothetical protein GGI04_005247, partial [Coemansia thaxteri]
MMPPPSSALALDFRLLSSEAEVHAAHRLEAAGYSEDEGASLESMLYRYRNAQHLFLGAFDLQTTLVGYIMSTQVAAPLVTHDSMSVHDPQGTTVCVHSVCVGPQWQRRGVAQRLLEEYTELVRKYNQECMSSADMEERISRIAMLSRADLVQLYERAGYHCLGPSTVIH